MMETIRELTTWSAIVTDGIAVAVIGFAVVEAFIRTIIANIRRFRLPVAETHVDELQQGARLQLAQSLGLGLEFLLAADIMRTAVAPSWQEIGQVAAIAALRTALNFFIQRELDSAQSRRIRRGRKDPTPE